MNKKIINLFEFERPITQKNWFPLAASVWAISPSGIYDGVLYSILEPEKLNENIFFSLYSMAIIVDNAKEFLIEKSTYADVVTTQNTWYYDGEVLYVHFPSSNTPYAYEDGQIYIGAYTGYYTSTNDKEISLFGGLYSPRLQSFPLYRSQLDDFAKGKQTAAGGSVVLENTDGALDNFSFGRDAVTKEEVLPKIGWYGRIRQAIIDIDATATDSDFNVIDQGFTTKITENVRVGNGYGVKIDLKDIRSSLDKSIELNKLSATTFTYMSTKDLETPPNIPIVYGKVSRRKTFCLNETFTGTNYQFLLGDASRYDFTAIDTVYIQDKETSFTPTILYQTQSDGVRIAYFEIARAEFVKLTSLTPTFDYVGYTEVSCDFQGCKDGTLIDNGLDIVKDLIEVVYSESYDTNNYDTTAWADITTIAPSVGLFIDSEITIKKVIEEVQKTIPLSSFIIDDNQKYSWVDYSWNDSEIIFTIYPDAFPQGYIPSPNVDAQKIGAKIQLNYDYRDTLKSWARVIDTSNATTALTKFNTDRTYPENYNTIINNATDAQTAIDRLKEHFFYPDTKLNLSIPMQYKSGDLLAYELKAGDKIKILANTQQKQLYGYLGCIINEIKQDIKAMTIYLSLKVIYTSDYTYKQPNVLKSSYDSKYLGDGAFVIEGIS